MTSISILFQSTHSCRVRLDRLSKWIRIIYFNPRTRVECDIRYTFDIPDAIHFNPRTRVECDGFQMGLRCRATYFNPRTRVECDFDRRCSPFLFGNFNPRTRVECDNGTNAGLFYWNLFQSTHSCRVRLIRSIDSGLPLGFQSTHSCRVRLPETRKAVHKFKISIHALV